MEDSPTFTIDSMHKCCHFACSIAFVVHTHIYIHYICARYTTKKKHLIEGVSYAKTLRYITSNCTTISFFVLCYMHKTLKAENFKNSRSACHYVLRFVFLNTLQSSTSWHKLFNTNVVFQQTIKQTKFNFCIEKTNLFVFSLRTKVQNLFC